MELNGTLKNGFFCGSNNTNESASVVLAGKSVSVILGMVTASYGSSHNSFDMDAKSPAAGSNLFANAARIMQGR